MKKKQLLIMMGLPGSGKSTWTKKNYPNATICSADHFFDQLGYFDASKLSVAHNQCKSKCKDALQKGVETVIIDNTNTANWERKPYIELAEENDYAWKIVLINQMNVDLLAERNVHGVPKDHIQKMKDRLLNSLKELQDEPSLIKIGENSNEQ